MPIPKKKRSRKQRSKKSQRLDVIRLFKSETGTKQVDMRDVVRFAIDRGWSLGEPVDPFEREAREFARAAAEEMRRDSETGKPYRANHAVPYVDKTGQTHFFWVDIDEAPRPQMHKSLVKRREQTAGDVVQMKLDEAHWNRVNPGAEPIDMPTDYSLDWELAQHRDDDEESAA